MSDTDAPATDAPTEPQEGDEATTFDANYVKKLRDEAAKYRTEAKANAEAAQRLAEIEQAQKSDAEKAADAIAAAKREAEQARLEATRYRITTEFKLEPEDAEALEHAASEEGMRLLAARLAAKSDERKKNGNVVRKEGATPSTPAGDETRYFLRSLVGRD